MPGRLLSHLRHAALAGLLLVAIVAATEIWLRSRLTPTVSTVFSQLPASEQSLIVPSAICHHELRRLVHVSHYPAGSTAGIPFRVNSYGCRGPEPAERPRSSSADSSTASSADVFRILLLGDDTVCGASLPENETLSALLEKLLSKSLDRPVEVLNGAVPGYCPLLSALKYDQELSKLDADLVILHFDMSDVSDDRIVRPWLLRDGPHSVCIHPTLRFHPGDKKTVADWVRQSATASWLFTESRQRGPALLSVESSQAIDRPFSWISDDPPDVRLQVRHALNPVLDLQSSVESRGHRLMVSTAPVLWQIVSGDSVPELTRQYGVSGRTPFASRIPFEVIGSFCESSGIAFCNPTDAFRRDDALRLFSTSAPVLSRLGTALYARELAHWIASHY